jgi:hypothetical protein
MRRIGRFFKEIIWIVGFMLLVLPMLEELGAQDDNPPVLFLAVRPPTELVIIEYPPLGVYEIWWQELAACEHLPLPIEHIKVQFFAVNGREFWPFIDPGWAIGYAAVRSGQLYFAFPYIANADIVKHEMLHFFQFWKGDFRDHPVELYGEEGKGKCGVVPHRRPVIDER